MLLIHINVVSHCPRHLVVSSQDLPHPHYFCTSIHTPARFCWRSWKFTCIKIILPASIDPYRTQLCISLPHKTRVPVPPRVGPACFQCFRTLENSRPPFSQTGGWEGNQTGNFFPLFSLSYFCIFFGVFLPFPIIYIHCK